MDQRRYITFVIISMGFFLLWMQIAPMLFPQLFPKPGKPPAAQLQPGEEKPAADGEMVPDPAGIDPQAPEEQAPPAKFPSRTVVLGKAGFERGYLVQAQANTKGGSIDWVQLTDPRYTTLDRRAQLKVVGSDVPPPNVAAVERIPRTLENTLIQLDAQLKKRGASLATVDWEIVAQDEDSVTFRYPAPDGSLEVLKTYTISAADLDERDESPRGYFVDCDLTVRNLSANTIETAYTLQGPVGMPLENEENTRFYREIKVGTLEDFRDPTDVTAISMTAAELSKAWDAAHDPDDPDPVDNWREPIKYAGIDDQFFAALLIPKENQLADIDKDGKPDPYVDVVEPLLLHRAEKPERSNVSVELVSRKISIDPGQEVTHSYQLFCGPKRSALLEAFSAGPVIQYGWFASVSKFMLLILNFFHQTIHLPYALSIIMLTVVVRLCMTPLTRRQLIQSEKMKLLQPKMKELQEKLKDKPEEFARATSELYRKYNVHPVSGCLPMFVQLPVLWGLYNALHLAIDLRLSQFLWIDNLAGPDHLFSLGFEVPFFGWDEFNLLPILTVALFIVQQKMFTPPPTSDEQAMTYKMMNVMMIVMGVMFYRMQAGLLIYFITSSLWGLIERQILKKFQPEIVLTEAPSGAGSGRGASRRREWSATKPASKASGPGVAGGEKKGWLERLIEAADAAKNATDGQSSGREVSNRKKRTRR